MNIKTFNVLIFIYMKKNKKNNPLISAKERKKKELTS